MKSAGGGRRKSRKPTGTEQDDRPRGYETQRMRQLWRDIDESKHKAGLGAASEAPAPSAWDLVGIVERATALAGEAVVWISSTAPAACALLAGGSALLRDVPVLGRLMALVPTEHGGAAAAPSSRGVEAHAGRGSETGAHPDRRGGDPNGEWIH
jgi:hypothetical protein